MIDKIVEGKIPQVVAVVFCVRQFLCKIEIEPATCFAKTKVVTIPASCAAIIIYSNQPAIRHLATDIPHVLFIIETEKSSGYISIIFVTTSPNVCVDEGYTRIIFKRLIKDDDTKISQGIDEHPELGTGNSVFQCCPAIVGNCI